MKMFARTKEKDSRDHLLIFRRCYGLQAKLNRWALFFLLPALIGYVMTIWYPFAEAFWMSLHDWPAIGEKKFIWFKNYIHLFYDPLFWQSLKVTLLWALGVVPLTIFFGLVISFLLNSHFVKAKDFWKTIYFIPVITNMVAASFVWRWLFEPTNGVINWFLRLLHLPAPGWLADTTWALPAMMIVAIWQQIGFAMVILLAGLKTIPQFIYEAAELDGVNVWQRFRYVTLPLINPTIVFLVVMMVINALRVFTIPYVMSAGGLTQQSAGGPLNSTRVFVINIYDIGFRQYEFGYASANAFVLLLLMIGATVIQLKLLQKDFEY